MKRLIVIAMALGFVSATAFAYGFGVPNDSVYEQEDAQYYNQQVQAQAYNSYLEKAQEEIKTGNITVIGASYLAALKMQQDQQAAAQKEKNEQPKSQVPMYQQQYDNAMAANQSAFAIKGASKIMTPYYEQQAKIQGQIGVAQAQDQLSGVQYNNQMDDMKRKNSIAKVKCNSVTRSPMDDFECSDQDYANYMYNVGRQEYNMRKVLDSWLHI